ncbi:MAG: alpha-mannosidase [Ruminococcaceae bacterium]|nr:alpha-mannosidase [Oscillospiraceae bacterium]
MTDFYEDRMEVFFNQLKDYMTVYDKPVEGFKFKECGYKVNNKLPKIDSSFREFGQEDRWGSKKDSHAWFYKKLNIPASLQGKNVEIEISTDKTEDGWDAINPQFIVYLDGKLVQGIDINHREIFLDRAKKSYELYIYAYSGMKESGALEFNASMKSYNDAVKKLYYSLRVPFEITRYLKPGEKDYVDIENHIINAVNLIDLRVKDSPEFKKSVKEAQKYLDTEFFGKYCRAEDVNAICIGHTHIDVAWLWTLAQTREKVQRTFSTVIALMKKYPEYKFMSSQAQLYKYLKEECPELYAEVKRLVRQGRWEVEGAMWVEADCNISSGESLVRQVLYGKRFFKEEFGVDSKVLWLPDVFGYSAALPQILRKSGVDKFITSKIGWNETNRMPYDTFWWKGIDGTDIFTYFMTAQTKIRGKEPTTGCTYNAKLEPAQLQGAFDRYQQKDINNEVLITFGYGDGGGGPVRKDLEYYNVLKKGLTAVPNAKMEFAGDFLARVKKKAEKSSKTPRWQGELYLEYHRGTYTSQAKNKRNNRKCEFLFEKAETLSVINELLNKKKYPLADLQDGWETILLNQFHDIIPGSSIKEVYEVSSKQYEQLKLTGNEISDKAYGNIADNVNTDGGIIVFNPNSFVGNSTVKVDGKTYYAENIPPKGYKVIPKPVIRNRVTATDSSIENDFFKLTFDEDGSLTRIYDKRNRRDVLKKGAKGNVITAYEDLPRDYDNWEISNYYTDKSWEVNKVKSVKQISDGARAGLEIKKSFLNSVIVQKIWLYDDIQRIDFDTYIDWKESHIVLKVAFPVDVNTDKATYDIQFGSVERPTHRNTSWDAAKFEVCAHKYADISEYGYGVSLINDCKYGHSINDGVMALTLLKSGTYPDPTADKCEHYFTYSLYPHADDFKQAGTIKEAYFINNPMTAFKIKKQKGRLADEFSLLAPADENIVIETVKKAENGDGIIVRMYESFNKRTDTQIKAGFDFKSVTLCDLLENDIKSLRTKDRIILVSLKPFEIVTLKIKV